MDPFIQSLMLSLAPLCLPVCRNCQTSATAAHSISRSGDIALLPGAGVHVPKVLSFEALQ